VLLRPRSVGVRESAPPADNHGMNISPTSQSPAGEAQMLMLRKAMDSAQQNVALLLQALPEPSGSGQRVDVRA
jgi:Putative motility protein